MKQFAVLLRGYVAVILPLFINTQPQCLDRGFPFRNIKTLDICTSHESFGCCTHTRSMELKGLFDEIVTNSTDTVSTKCKNILLDLICQECSPFALRIFNDIENSHLDEKFPNLCVNYCGDMIKDCGWLVAHLTSNQTLVELATQEKKSEFCAAVSSTDAKYCFDDVKALEDNSNLGRPEYFQKGEYKKSENCTSICVTEILSGLRNPLTLKHANDKSMRMFIGEQPGSVLVYNSKFEQLGTFLDIENSVLKTEDTYDERGFLDIAFHPDYMNNGRFFICYFIQKHGDNGTQYVTINEMEVSNENPNKANLQSEKTVLEIEQPESNHNGGQLLFGDDGYLYIFTGDGGGEGDPWGANGNAQNKSSLLGKVLRIDIDNKEDGKKYAVPNDNPFINSNEYLPEIYALGIRNSWRCSKDRGDHNGNGKGRIFCGDVGEEAAEEINLIEKGANYGWKAYEGNLCYDEDLCKTDIDYLTPPIFSYTHPSEGGRSITGGYVYRGCQNPNLQGTYLFGDFMTGGLFSLVREGGAWKSGDICLGGKDICYGKMYAKSYSNFILAFGEDEEGEVYILSTSVPLPGSANGSVYKIFDPSRRGNPQDACEQNSGTIGHVNLPIFVHIFCLLTIAVYFK